MYLILIVGVMHFVSSSEERSQIQGDKDSMRSNPISLNRKNTITTHNATYIEKAENMLRVPVLREYFEEQKSKRKIKKSPKRTIQKIIKNNRKRSKKIYLHQTMIQSTPLPKKEYGNVQEESQWKEDIPTTQSNQKKKSRKRNSKIARYPMPFQKKQRKEYKYKRSVDRDDHYIIEDLDEVEFLSSDKDYDVVNAHVKNYW